MLAPSRIEPDLGFESDERLANRLAWMTGLRLGFLTLLLVATAFFYLRGALGSLPAEPGASSSRRSARAFALAAIYATVAAAAAGTSGASPRCRSSSTSSRGRPSSTSRAVPPAAPRRSTGSRASSARSSSACAARRSRRSAASTHLPRRCAPASRLGLDRAARAISAPRTTSSRGTASVYPLAVNVLGIVVVALLAGLPRRAPASHRRRARRGQRARARGRAPRAARSDRRRPRARDPQPARLDRGLDRDAPGGAGPHRGGPPPLRHRPARGRRD